MKNFRLGFGKTAVALALPEEKILDVVEGNAYPAIQDVGAAVLEALRRPIGAPPLREVVKAGDKVVLLCSDVTRAWVRQKEVLPYIFNELNAAGVPDADISILVAGGAHRKHTPAEDESTYGREAVERVAIIQIDAQNPDEYVHVGTTSNGVPVGLHKVAVNADKVILLGGIVYHLMAGFGGGRKSILPGISAYETIQGNHRFCLNEVEGRGVNPACASGKLEGNKMQDDMMEIAAMLNPAFLFNIVLNAEGEFAKFVAGHWDQAWREGCAAVERIFGVKTKGRADLVIASAGGYPKDINLYQGIKTIDNAAMACRDDGVVILLLECCDIKEPAEFSDWFNYESLVEREHVLRRGFTVPGFIALKLGLTAKRIPHIVVTLPQNKAFVEKTGMIAAASLEEAVAMAEAKLGREDYKVIVMPHAANTMPIIEE